MRKSFARVLLLFVFMSCFLVGCGEVKVDGFGGGLGGDGTETDSGSGSGFIDSLYTFVTDEIEQVGSVTPQIARMDSAGKIALATTNSLGSPGDGRIRLFELLSYDVMSATELTDSVKGNLIDRTTGGEAVFDNPYDIVSFGDVFFVGEMTTGGTGLANIFLIENIDLDTREADVLNLVDSVGNDGTGVVNGLNSVRFLKIVFHPGYYDGEGALFLYFSENTQSNSGRIRRILLSGDDRGRMETVVEGLTQPADFEVTPRGLGARLTIALSGTGVGSSRVVYVDLSEDVVSEEQNSVPYDNFDVQTVTIQGGGNFLAPFEMELDDSGNIYVTDGGYQQPIAGNLGASGPPNGGHIYVIPAGATRARTLISNVTAPVGLDLLSIDSSRIALSFVEPETAANGTVGIIKVNVVQDFEVELRRRKVAEGLNNGLDTHLVSEFVTPYLLYVDEHTFNSSSINKVNFE